MTTIHFDGLTHTITGPVTCTAQPDGKLVILATDGGHQTVRVQLKRDHQLVVEKVGLRLSEATGFSADTSDMWATKSDAAYTISGGMPPQSGETARHQFVVETTCRFEVPLPYTPPRAGNGLP